MNRIHRFRIKIDRAHRFEKVDKASIIHVDESFVHHEHISSHSQVLGDMCKHYLSFNYQVKRSLKELEDQIRAG